MKKFILATTFMACGLVPAYAGTYSVEYTPDTGDVIIVDYDDAAMTMSWDDNTAPYTFDADSSTICGELPDNTEICVTFETVGNTVGHTTKYEASDGTKGTAKVISASE